MAVGAVGAKEAEGGGFTSDDFIDARAITTAIEVELDSSQAIFFEAGEEGAKALDFSLELGQGVPKFVAWMGEDDAASVHGHYAADFIDPGFVDLGRGEEIGVEIFPAEIAVVQLSGKDASLLEIEPEIDLAEGCSTLAGREGPLAVFAGDKIVKGQVWPLEVAPGSFEPGIEFLPPPPGYGLEKEASGLVGAPGEVGQELGAVGEVGFFTIYFTGREGLHAFSLGRLYEFLATTQAVVIREGHKVEASGGSLGGDLGGPERAVGPARMEVEVGFHVRAGV
jgi:hypothetical protein